MIAMSCLTGLKRRWVASIEELIDDQFGRH
jgi:hypothetical protein